MHFVRQSPRLYVAMFVFGATVALLDTVIICVFRRFAAPLMLQVDRQWRPSDRRHDLAN